MDVVKSDDCQSNRECCGACETGQSVKLTWGRSSSSRFLMIFDFRHLLCLSVGTRLTLSEHVGEFAAVWIAPWCEELRRAKELKSMLLLTRANQKCANEPLMHTRHTSLLRIIHYSVLWFIHVFISLSQNGTVPSFVVYVSNQPPGEFRHNKVVPRETLLKTSYSNPQQVVYLRFEVLHWLLFWVF